MLEIIRPNTSSANAAKHRSRIHAKSLDREQLQQLQLQKLNRLLAEVLPRNKFYADRLGANLQLRTLEEWSSLPTVSKNDLVSKEASDFALNHTFEHSKYLRMHRTSGTRGRPMIVMDTEEDWQWWLDTWQYVWDAAEVQSQDTVFMAFSFGPFIGFWSAFEAATQRGLKTVPGGGLSSVARLDLIRASQANVLCCTPTYAIHLAEEAEKQQLELATLGLKKIVVAGEPGGSIASVRKRIEDAWQAKVIDHAGATEVGPWGYGSREGNDLVVIESEFIAEFIPLDQSHAKALAGEPSTASELVLTALGRKGAPALRYRTGDVVCADFQASSDSSFVKLRGGILGRADDMLIIRGVNVFPSSIESILRSMTSILEYRMTVEKEGAMDQLTIEVEDQQHDTQRIAEAFAVQLGLRVTIVDRPLGSLPRFEGKANRFVDLRKPR